MQFMYCLDERSVCYVCYGSLCTGALCDLQLAIRILYVGFPVQEVVEDVIEHPATRKNHMIARCVGSLLSG